MTRVDVAIPCFNYGRYLRQSVTSVLRQQDTSVRVLIVDNASTDDSLSIARQLSTEDSRVEVVAHRTNLGYHASYNEGIDWAASEYFILLDADDMLAPGSLARATRVMDANPGVVLTHGAEAFATATGMASFSQLINPPQDDWTIISGRDFIRGFCRTGTNPAATSTVVRRTWAQKRAGYYRKELPHTCDVELWLRIAMHGDVARTSATQAIRRLHPQQITRFVLDTPVRDFAARVHAIESFFTQEGRLLPDRDRLHNTAIRAVEDHAYWSAVSHFLRGYRQEARELMTFAHTSSRLTVRIPPVAFLANHSNAAARAVEVVSRVAFSRRSKPGFAERAAGQSGGEREDATSGREA